MKLDLAFREADGYLLVQVEGEWTPEAVQQGIEEVAQAAEERGHDRVLLDIRNMSGPKTDLHRFLAGEHAAKAWGHPLRLKVAAVYKEELIDKFTENVAVNRGANIIVLSDIDEAIEWLTRDPTTK